MASSSTPIVSDAAAGLVQLRPFPHLARLNAMPSARAREVYARGVNNPHSFLAMNRRYIRAAASHEAPPLSEAGRRVAQDLADNGIAFAGFGEFFVPELCTTLTERFHAYVEEFARESRGTAKGKGVYLDTVHKSHTFVTGDAVSTYLADAGVAAVAREYMGMVPRFVGTSFWRTRTATGSDRIYSQLWHRDYNDRMLMKVFLYITDVGPTEGYFEYLAGSHESGLLGPLFDRIGPDGFRAYPEADAVDRVMADLPVFDLDQVAPADRSGARAPWHRRPAVVRCIAPKATLIFADTYGMHRGGFVQQGYRDMVMTTYSTNFNVHKPHYAVTRGFADGLSPLMRLSFGID